MTCVAGMTRSAEDRTHGGDEPRVGLGTGSSVGLDLGREVVAADRVDSPVRDQRPLRSEGEDSRVAPLTTGFAPECDRPTARQILRPSNENHRVRRLGRDGERIRSWHPRHLLVVTIPFGREEMGLTTFCFITFGLRIATTAPALSFHHFSYAPPLPPR